MTGLKTDEELERILQHARKTNTILLYAPCKRGCVFCMNHSTGPLMAPRPTMSRKLTKEDFLLIAKTIDLGKPVSLLGNEVMDYPGFIDLVRILKEAQDERSRKGLKINYIDMISTCADFKLEWLELFKNMPTLLLNVSLITFDIAKKNRLMRGGWTPENDRILREIIKAGILNAAYVWVLDNLAGLKKDLDILDELMGDSQRPGFTLVLSYPSSNKYSTSITKALTEKALPHWDDALHTVIELSQTKGKFKNVHFPIRDLSKYPREISARQRKYMSDFRRRVKEAVAFVKENRTIKLGDVGFLAAEASYNYGKEIFPDLNWLLVQSDYWDSDLRLNALITFHDIDLVAKKTSFPFLVVSKSMLSDKEEKRDCLKMRMVDQNPDFDREILFF